MSSHPPYETLSVRASAQIHSAAQHAAAILNKGGLVVLPTETLYGVAARADLHDAVRALAHATHRPPDSLGSSWHLSADGIPRAIEAVAPLPLLHRRIIERLAPGPVRFSLDIPRGWPLPRGTADDGTRASLRIVQDPMACAVLSACDGPVVVNRIGLDARVARGVPGAALVVDTGPTTFGRPATSVALGRTPAGIPCYGVESGHIGAMEERVIHRRIQRTILFACTGNTCRSPMAMAIASHWLSNASPESLGYIPTIAASAGVSAAEGEPASRENGPALRALGISPEPHRATRLTAGMIADAEAVFVMTQSHARAVRSISGPGGGGGGGGGGGVEPGLHGKIRLLDPAGDIEDPFGGTQKMYDDLARRLRDLVADRLAELISPAQTKGGTP